MEDWYRWFLNGDCGLWKDDSHLCPIIARQRNHVCSPSMRYYPEAIWGDPRNAIWFVPINPGQVRAASSDAPKIAVEQKACLNTRDNPISTLTLDQYIGRHDLRAILGRDEHDPLLADRVTSAAFGLLMGQTRPVEVDDPRFDKELRLAKVANLTILNMAHCKCPEYSGLDIEQQRRSWRQCGSKNLDAFRMWKPKLLVIFGRAPTNWLWDLRPRAGRDDPWVLTGWNFYEPGRLRHEASGWAVNLLLLPHPSSRGRVKYDPEKAIKAFRKLAAQTEGVSCE